MTVRITTVLDDKINKFCDRLNLTRSAFVYKAIIHYLISKGYKDIERLNEMELAKSITREENHCLYLGTNAIMTIVRMAKTSLLLTGKIDPEKLRIPIKNYKRLYNSMPTRLKKVLKYEMKMIEKLQYPIHLKEYITNWDLVQEFMSVEKKAKRLELK